MNVLINDNLISDTFKNFIYSHEHELNKVLKAIGDDFYPSAENVLRFARVNINKIKVIILGMDPYPSSYNADSSRRGELASPLEKPVATGRSFEVANVDSWCQKLKQASLTNILKSLYYLKFNKEEKIENIRNEIKENKFKILPPHEWFDKMEEEGVLFLNDELKDESNKPKIIYKVHPASRVKNDFVVNNGFSEIKNINWV